MCANNSLLLSATNGATTGAAEGCSPSLHRLECPGRPIPSWQPYGSAQGRPETCGTLRARPAQEPAPYLFGTRDPPHSASPTLPPNDPPHPLAPTLSSYPSSGTGVPHLRSRVMQRTLRPCSIQALVTCGRAVLKAGMLRYCPDH